MRLFVAGFGKSVVHVNRGTREVDHFFQQIGLTSPVVADIHPAFPVRGDIIGVSVSVDIDQLGAVGVERVVFR